MSQISNELKIIARILKSSVYDGEKKKNVVKSINKNIREVTKGFYSDEDWSPINKVWKFFKDMDTDYKIIDSNYEWENNKMVRKIWKFEVYFENENGKYTTLYGNIVASGAGSVKNPMDRYDVVGYVS